jgi:hypothetical protein
VFEVGILEMGGVLLVLQMGQKIILLLENLLLILEIQTGFRLPVLTLMTLNGLSKMT